jgi:hypothetical protein
VQPDSRESQGRQDDITIANHASGDGVAMVSVFCAPISDPAIDVNPESLPK